MQSYGCSFTPAINKTRREGNRRKKKEEGWEGKGGRKELAIKVSKPKEGARSWLRELRVLVKERRGDERRREPEQGLNTRRREKGRVGRGEGTRKILPFFFSLDPRSPSSSSSWPLHVRDSSVYAWYKGGVTSAAPRKFISRFNAAALLALIYTHSPKPQEATSGAQLSRWIPTKWWAVTSYPILFDIPSKNCVRWPRSTHSLILYLLFLFPSPSSLSLISSPILVFSS